MKTPNFRRNRAAAAVAGAVLALGATQAFGTGFQLNENSGSSLGNANAAGAAFTDDVSAMWWNPAALSLFPRIQAAGALHIITPSIKFSNNASQPAAPTSCQTCTSPFRSTRSGRSVSASTLPSA